MIAEEIVIELNDLIQLDIDALHAYAQAVQRVDDSTIRDNLERFMEDHGRHIDLLSQTVRELSADPPAFSRDFKGFLIEGFTTALAGIAGSRGALEAMRVNEKLTNRGYAWAASLDFPSDILLLVRGGLEDERRHLEYIEKVLETHQG